MKTKLIAGLGNPGDEYEDTYHNVGAQAIKHMTDALQEAGEAVAWDSHKNLFRYAKTSRAIFIVPLLYMNEAGQAVKEALKKFNMEPKDLVVVHDESDLAVGDHKLSSDRGSAGHKGVQSIMDALGSQEFLRVRIGIRPKNEARRKKAEEFVLVKVKSGDQKILGEVFKKISAEVVGL